MYACGIDFGTSNSTIALAENGRVRQLAIDPGSAVGFASPTLLYFGEDTEPVFGSSAVSDYLESEMEGRLIQSIKKYLPSKSFDGTWINGQKRSIEALVGGYLRYLKVNADAAAGEPVRSVVLGRPARFHLRPELDLLAQTRLEAAARIAGFEDIHFQIEPIAAARRFEQSLDGDVLCFVGDFGGGTSDFTVIRLSPDRIGQTDRTGDVLGVAGVPVGGTDFDARIMQHHVLPHFGHNTRYRPLHQWMTIPTGIHHAITRWHTACLASTRTNLDTLKKMMRTAVDSDGLGRLHRLLEEGWFYVLFQSVEAVKIALSAQESADLVFSVPGIDIRQSITRGAFEDSIGEEVRRIEQCVDTMLADLGLSADDISVAFLTGGSSKIPLIHQLFAERFSQRIVTQDAFTSVGTGLGVEAAARTAQGS
ncbi:MAG: putative chaperone protein [Myxococcota bacterium]|jgi:hypothetical chaperone protein